MTIQFTQRTARVRGEATVEDAETLLGWFLTRPRGRVDLAACTHVHAASLQVLMAVRPAVARWPADPSLARWIRAVLSPSKESSP